MLASAGQKNTSRGVSDRPAPAEAEAVATAEEAVHSAHKSDRGEAQQRRTRTPPTMAAEEAPAGTASPVLSALVPCNPVALDIGGSLVKIVFWERENGPKLPNWVRPDTGPKDLPLRPLSRTPSPAPLARSDSGALFVTPIASPAPTPIVTPPVTPSSSPPPAPDGTVVPTVVRRARFCDAHGFSVECLWPHVALAASTTLLCCA